MSTPAIEFQAVQKSFGLAFALGPLTLSVPIGAIYALIGPNGAGKSTTLNMLMGVGQPEHGRIEVLGRNLQADEVEIKRRTAYVSPDMDFRAWGKVGNAVDFTRGFYPDWNAERCERLLFQFGVHRNERVGALSFGARIKLALILALSREPQLLILDEPTLGLDAISRRQLFAELLSFMQREERTILISSHQLADLERFADHAAIIDQGRLLTCGRMDELIERYSQLDVQWDRTSPGTISGVYVLDQQGDRARLLVDRNAITTEALAAHGVHVLAEVPLALEDLFLGLIQGANSRKVWRPHLSAA
jgi:ABC-2 type transport system ATP-binding protein